MILSLQESAYGIEYSLISNGLVAVHDAVAACPEDPNESRTPSIAQISLHRRLSGVDRWL